MENGKCYNHGFQGSGPDDPEQGPENDPQVGPDGSPGGVVQVQTDLVRHDVCDIGFLRIHCRRQDIVFIMVLYRCRSRDPGPEVEDFPLVVGIMVNVVLGFGPGTHQAHLPLQHVPKLGQLVQLGLTQEPAHPGDPGIPAHGQGKSQGLGIRDHGAELEHLEAPPLSAHPKAPVKDRARRGEFDQEGQDKKQGPENEQAQERKLDVHRPFKHPYFRDLWTTSRTASITSCTSLSDILL